MRPLFSLTVLAALVFVAGCDTVGQDPVVLSPRDVQFTYIVDFDNASGTVQATQTAGLVGNLDGFQVAEITAARVSAVRFERMSPVTKSLGDLLATAEVRIASTSVAAGTVPNVARETTLTPTGNSVTSEVARPTFSSTLAFTPEAGASGTFTFRATLTLSIEVEGL